jgi:hypothetical protein
MPDLALDLSGAGPAAAGSAFAVDWPVSVEPTESSGNVAALAVITQDFDVSALPDNSVAIIRFAFVVFATDAPGGCETLDLGILVALRDEGGALTTDINSYQAPAANVGGAGVTAGITAIFAPDADTVRLEITNGARAASYTFRWAISFVSSPAPVPPP